MTDLDFEPQEKDIIKRIVQRFLASGQGMPAREFRVELAKSRHFLDELRAKRAIQLCGDKYYPSFLAREVLEPNVCNLIGGSTGLVLQSLKALYRESGKDQFSFQEVLAKAKEIDPSISAERVNLGMLMASDFHVYVSSWGLGGTQVPNNEGISSVGILETILDYETVEQAWEDECRHRQPRVLPAERGEMMDVVYEDLGIAVPAAADRPRGVAKTDLHPWPVIFGFLSGLSSDGLVRAISSTGLEVGWQLTKEESYSHKTRVRAYLPRIQEAFQVLPGEKQLIVAALVAVELARGNPDRGRELDTRLSQIGWRLEADRLIPAKPDVRELFFPKGSQHDAYVEIRSLLQQTTCSIVLIDPWIDGSLFPLLASITAQDIEIQVLTSKVPADFPLEARKFLTQHTRFRMEIRLTGEFHDRFLVIDSTACYHVGASIKDAGSKVFMISRVEDTRNRDALLAHHRQSWDSAKVVFPGAAVA